MAGANAIPIDVADQGQVQDRAKKAKDAQRESDDAIKAFMSHKQGRAWVWDHLSACGIYNTSFAQNPHVTAFNEGQRNIGLRLLAQLQRACPDLYATMSKENTDER